MAYITPSVLVFQDLLNSGGVLNATPDLETCIIGVANNVVKYVAGNTASSILTAAGSITNSTISNTFNLPSQKVGQVASAASATVWVDNATIEAATASFSFRTGSNRLVSITQAHTGSITSAQNTLTLNVADVFTVGDTVSVAGAGAAGAALIAKVTIVAGNIYTLDTPASTTVSSVAVTEVYPTNYNGSTGTYIAVPGDTVTVFYTDTSSISKTFTTTIQSVATSTGQTGRITELDLADTFATGVTSVTTGSATGGTSTLTVASATNIAIGTKLFVAGAGTGGASMDVTVTAVTGTTITVAETLVTTIVSLPVTVYQNGRVSIRKVTSGAQILTGSVVTTGVPAGTITVSANPLTALGLLISGDVKVDYTALRTDLAGRVLTYNNISDVIGELGVISDANPLALACQIALANTTGRIRAISVTTNDLAGYQAALTTSEAERLYFIVPLTQDETIHATVASHVQQMSTPANAAWRVAVLSDSLDFIKNIGIYSSTSVNANGGLNTIANVGGTWVLTASNATFIADGVVPGDIVNITASSPTASSTTYTVGAVLSNQQVALTTGSAVNAVSYYVTRSMTKAQQAAATAAKARAYNTKRVWLTFPSTVGVVVNGVTKYLPGYYLSAGLAGMGSGFPVQQGFTNIGVAGISDLQYSNYFFSKTDLGTMAEAGVCIFAQDTQGGIPYCRHELTTDVSVLENREMLVVKNWDFLSYFYYDKLRMFIGKWNITVDTLNIIRQTIDASSALLKSQKLPKIGPPLIDGKITSLEQNAFNKDNLDVLLAVKVVYPLNYLNLHLVI